MLLDLLQPVPVRDVFEERVQDLEHGAGALRFPV